MQRNVVNVSYFISDFDFDLDYIVYMIQGSCVFLIIFRKLSNIRISQL